MGVQSAGMSRVDAVTRATKVWTGQLVDLSARNNLLYYRDLKVGTLDLGQVEPELLSSVLQGKTVRLSRLFPDEEGHAGAARRARAVRNRSQEHFEERGLETLFLACGLATWTNPKQGGAQPAAPVLFVPARLVPRGAAQDDFELSLTGELEVNPTLLQMLQSEFDCRCDPEELLSQAGMEGAVDTPEELDIAYRWLAERAANVPGFSVASRFVVGTFSYAKLPMVKDLEGSIEAMAEHELVAALAGDEQAQAAVRERHPAVDPKMPDRTPPADEFLVLDADASQNYAINAVLAGQDLIIKGPPGTGKSQTIVNLISTLVARGKRVLFVAEKRAAIDAVLKRLDTVGLGDLVLDLHEGAGSRGKVAQSLAAALTANTKIARPDQVAQQRRLQARREELNVRVEALHGRRPPWNVSVFDAQSRLLGMDLTVTTSVRFRGTMLTQLDGQAFEGVAENLRAYVGLGGLALPSSGSPWAKASIISSEHAQAAQELVDRLRHHTLPSVQKRLRAAAQQTGLQPAETVEGWGQTLKLWEDVRRCQEVFKPAVYEEPLTELLPVLAPVGEGTGKRARAWLSSGAYRSARKQMKALRSGESSIKGAELLATLQEAAQQVQRWADGGTDGKPPSSPEDLDALITAFGQLEAELGELARHLGVERLGGSVDDLIAQLDALLADTPTLGKLPELHRRWSALRGAGLDELLGDLASRGLAPAACKDAFEYAWLASIVEHVSLTDPLIGAFDGSHHSRTVAEFQVADRHHIETTAERVRRICAEQATRIQDTMPTQAALIRDQAARKRGHLPLRQLFSAAPDVMTALKPCWAMSPLVVSQLLPADRQYFDVVVFDEASQIRPADAIPSILRGKRVVVAGDERQLPPTDFFTGATPEVDAPEMDGRIALDAGYESILDAMLPYISFRMLGWHYRSRDERLISFSNAHLYDRGLITFPGVAGAESIRHVLVPFTPGDADSDVSADAEVECVVGLILEHAEKRPEETLGVIAMGLRHAQRIDETLRRELRDREDLHEFFDETHEEKFFLKNLERVQGDERDAIILSVGYGKNSDGRLRYFFGPLNTEGGERRLNVAVTRAKQRMTLVSSFAFADMDPDRSKRGVDLLRLYLQYAASGGEDLGPRAMHIPELNPFEVDVRDTLERAGIPLCAQYGCSGYRIDYAAKHPTQPGRMVLAIECDGASYHSSETARDRDRLRQEQLERLGWTFHRIWSQDWFHNKTRETEKTLAAYQMAVVAADSRAQNGDRAAVPLDQVMPSARAAAPERRPRPPIPRFRKIHEYTQADLQSIVRWIESDTLLRTKDQLVTEVMDDLGFKRRGTRIVGAISAAIAAERRGY